MPKKKRAKITKARIQKDPAFERTRETNTEFKRAANANKLLRAAFREALLAVADRYVSGRLTKRMYRIVQSDTVSDRGNRRIRPAALPMLEGFNFNPKRPLNELFYAPYDVRLDRPANQVAIHIPFFIGRTMVDVFPDFGDYIVIACAATIDFENQEETFVQADSGTIFSNDLQHRPLQLILPLPEPLNQPVIVTLGIQCSGEKEHNSMAIVKVFV